LHNLALGANKVLTFPLFPFLQKRLREKNGIELDMPILCAKCKEDTSGTKRVFIIITDSSGQLGCVHVYFHYDCLQELWDFKKFIDVTRLVHGNEIIRKHK